MKKKTNSPKFIIAASIGIMYKSEYKFFLNPQNSNTTYIAKVIFIIPTEDAYK